MKPSEENKLNRRARLCGISILVLFILEALLLSAIAIIEQNYTLRTFGVIVASVGIGVIGYGAARFLGYFFNKITKKG